MPLVCVVCHIAPHIYVQVLSQGPRRSDGLSTTRADLVGTQVRQLCSHGAEDPRPVNDPVAVDDWDTAFGLQSWRETPSSFITLVFVTLCVCVCLWRACVCTQVAPALYCLPYGDVTRPCWNLCNLMVANTEEHAREIPPHHLKPLPTHTYAHFYVEPKPQVQTLHVPPHTHTHSSTYICRHSACAPCAMFSPSQACVSTV